MKTRIKIKRIKEQETLPNLKVYWTFPTNNDKQHKFQFAS